MNETTTERARACYIVHQGACEQWTHGKPVDIWRDENHILCIKYMDSSEGAKAPSFFMCVVSL